MSEFSGYAYHAPCYLCGTQTGFWPHVVHDYDEGYCDGCASYQVMGRQARESMQKVAKPGTPPDPKFLKQDALPYYARAMYQVAFNMAQAEMNEWFRSQGDWMTPKSDNSQSQRAATIPPAPTHPTARIRIVEDREARLGAAKWVP